MTGRVAATGSVDIRVPSKPSAVMKMLMRTVKKTKTVVTLFIVLSFGCFLISFKSYFTIKTSSSPTSTCRVMEMDSRTMRGM